MLDKFYYDDLIMMALKEDMPLGDITTENIIRAGTRAKAMLIARQDAVIAGLDVFERVFKLLDANTAFTRHVQDGGHVAEGDVFMEFEGEAAILLKGERTALNFLQHLSGIATKTAEFCKLVEDLPVKIVDTRKTTPGLRHLEKYAVRIGGGYNHRFCLSDGVLIKDNHIKAAGGIKQAIEQVRAGLPHTLKIEVETESLEQVKEALEAGADIIMFDNMSREMMTQAAKLVGKRAITEASGDVHMDTVRDVALTGVDIVSIGELTHTVKAANISMRFV
ncbi:MAG: carboxylating nicotinate-nucleotide diphosphorylase [Clostridiaceae bacterium]